MIIPVRCMSCGKPIGHLWEEFSERAAAGEAKKALDELGAVRFCCRSALLGHVNLIDTAAKFKRF